MGRRLQPPYNGLDPRKDWWAVFPILVYGFDEEADTVYIADRSSQPFVITPAQLAAARGRVKKDKLRLLTLEPPDPNKLPVTVQQGVWDCLKRYTEAPVKNAAKNFGLAAFRRWADVLTKPKDKQSWEIIFPPGVKMYASLSSAFDRFGLGAAATKVNNACISANEITVEAWIRPTSTAQGGAGIVPRIVTISTDTANRNIALVHGNQIQTALYSGRLRTTATDSNGSPDVETADGSLTTSLTHVVYTRDSAGNVVIYLNNSSAATGTIGGDLSGWNTGYLLALANEFSLDRPWLGEYHLVAIYCRALTAGEVSQNYTTGP